MEPIGELPLEFFDENVIPSIIVVEIKENYVQG